MGERRDLTQAGNAGGGMNTKGLGARAGTLLTGSTQASTETSTRFPSTPEQEQR